MAQNSASTHRPVSAEQVRIDVSGSVQVCGLWQRPTPADAVLLLAHGAGAGMRHPFLAQIASELAARAIATLRYQFPYMERGAKRPDPPQLCYATVRAASAAATRFAPELPLFAGGKSFGGRMSSQAQAAAPLAAVRGLVFLGFPLHPPGQPSLRRGEHLCELQLPLLFLQGTRDDFANLELQQALIERIGARARLKLVPDADHSFRVRGRGAGAGAEVLGELADAITNWIHGRLQGLASATIAST